MNDTNLDQSISNNLAALNQLQQAALSPGGDATQPWTPQLVEVLGGGILLFCIICLIIAAFMLKGRQADGTTILKIFGLILIICISAFLMVTGYGESQLTPIVGLFGAIAGYLLGKEKAQTP